MQIQVVERFEDIPLRREQWNALASANATNTIFQTFEWFESWWHSFGGHHRLWFVTLHADDRIVGFLPLVRAAGKSGQSRNLQVAGASHADYVDVVVEPQHAAAGIQALMEFLQKRADSWRELRIRNVQMGSPTLALMKQQASATGFEYVERGRVPCPLMQISGRREQVTAMLGKYSMRRSTNWFNARGALGYHVLQADADIVAELPAFFDQHVSRWSGTNISSRFTDPDQREFYTHLAKTMNHAGWLSFSKVTYEGEPLAYHFGFRFGEHLLWYKPSFNPRFRRHSPGIVLIRRLIEQAMASGCGWIDFGVGDEAFKSRFATGSTFSTDLILFSSHWNSVRGKIGHLFGRAHARVRQWQ